MKIRKITFAAIATFFSWGILLFGLAFGVFYCTISAYKGVVIIFIALFFALIIKVTLNMHKILLDFSINSIKINDEICHVLKDNFKAIYETQIGIRHTHKDNFKAIYDAQMDIRNVLECNLKLLCNAQTDNLILNYELKNMIAEQFKDLHQSEMDILLVINELKSNFTVFNKMQADTLSISQQINCDSRDINKILHEIRLTMDKLKE